MEKITKTDYKYNWAIGIDSDNNSILTLIEQLENINNKTIQEYDEFIKICYFVEGGEDEEPYVLVPIVQRLETDEEFEKRKLQQEKFDNNKKEKDFELYQKLKAQFEGE